MCVVFVMSFKNSSGALCTNNPILLLRCQRSNGQLEGQGGHKWTSESRLWWTELMANIYHPRNKILIQDVTPQQSQKSMYARSPVFVYSASYGNWPCHNIVIMAWCPIFPVILMLKPFIRKRWHFISKLGKFSKREFHHCFCVGRAVYGCTWGGQPVSQPPSSKNKMN